MATLIGDAAASAEWIATALKSSGYKADFSIASLKEIDRFFEEQCENGIPTPTGLLGQQLGTRMFALGSYVGEVVRCAVGGTWRGNDNDPQGEINIELLLSDGTVIWPVQRVMKRLKNGREDGVHVYGTVLLERVRGAPPSRQL